LHIFGKPVILVMNYTYHFLFRLSAAFLFIFISNISVAQPRGMTMNQVYSQLNKQDMNQRMQMQMQQMANMNWRQNAGKGGSYYVTFKDSSRKQVVSYMYYDTVHRKSFLLFVNKKFPKSDSAHRLQKIYPAQTLNLAFGEEERAKYGLPTDTGWTFKVISGAITVYAKNMDYTVITGTPAFSAPTLGFVPSAIIGIQLNDGPLEKLTKENVLKMVSQDAKAAALLEKKGSYEAVAKYNKDIEKAAEK
jgi:hypothetical protein